MSLILVPFESTGVVSCSPSIVTVAVSVAVCEIFSVKEWRDLENQVRGRSRSLEMVPFDTQYATFYWSAIVNIALSCTIFECICSIRADLCCVCCVVLTSPSPSFFRSFVCQHESSLPHKVSVCSYIPYHSIDSFVCFLQYMYLCLLHDECVVNGEIQNCVVFKGLPTSLP